ncbi:MAG: polysaccharide pyruvyl transferase family protein [Candidatus Thorarchaeota archaeon]
MEIYSIVVFGGGTVINEPGFLKKIKSALDSGHKVFILGAGVRNPIFWDKVKGDNNYLSEWIDCLKSCSFVGVRGPISKKILAINGYNGALITGDPVLYFARDNIKRKLKNKVIGINIGISNGLVWGSEKEILDKIVKLSQILIKKGWKLKFLPVWNRDIPYIQEAIKNIGRKIEVFSEWHSLDKTFNFLEDCDLFIGEKLHSVVLATCVYTPSIMLEYRPKCLDFMMSMNLEKFNIRTDKLNIDLILDLLYELYQNAESYQKNIFNKAHFYRKMQIERSNDITKEIFR